MKLDKAFIIFLALASATLLGNTVTWTGTGDNESWGDPNNWSTKTTLPMGVDTVSIPVASMPTNKVIKLGADRAVQTVTFTDNGNNAYLYGGGQYTLTLLNGNLNAASASGPLFDCDILLGASGTWQAGGWGKWLKVLGNVSDGGAGYTISTAGGQNSNVGFLGNLSITGSLIVKNYLVSFGYLSALTNALGVAVGNGGVVANAADLQLDESGLTDDFTYTATLKLDNTIQINSNRIADSVPVRYVGNGGTFFLQGNASGAVSERIGGLRLEGGRGDVTFGSGSSSAPVSLFVDDFRRSKGSHCTVNVGVDTNSKWLFWVKNAVNDRGMFAPWAFSSSAQNFLTVLETEGDGYGKLGYLPDASFSTFAATGNDPNKPAILSGSTTSLALASNEEVWALRCTAGTDTDGCAIHLGNHDLTIGSGAIIHYGLGPRTIDSSGGALVFGGEEIILSLKSSTSGKSGGISAPIKWRRPNGSSVEYPDLVIPCANFSTNEFVLNGEDGIGDYGAFAAPGGGSSSKFVFDGPWNRTFHGTLSGALAMEKRGTGTLTFAGPANVRRGLFTVSGGKLVFHSTSFPAVTVTNGAVCCMAEGASFRSSPIVYGNSTIEGIGLLSSMNATSALRGCRFAPGFESSPGLLTMDTFTPKGSFAVDVLVNATSNSLFRVSKQYFATSVANEGTPVVTVRMTDPTRGHARLRGRTFTVFKNTDKYTGSPASNLQALNVQFENGSPSFIDASNVQIEKVIDGVSLTINVSGLKSTGLVTTIVLK